MTPSKEVLEMNPEYAQLIGQAIPASITHSEDRPTESSFQRDVVIPWLHSQGWLVHAERAARTAKGWCTPIQGDPGYPDITAVHPLMHRLILVEVKTDVGQASPNQIRWLVALGKCAETYVVTPATLVEFQERTANKSRRSGDE